MKNEIKILREQYGAHTRFIVYSYDASHPFFIDDSVQYVPYFPIGIRQWKNLGKNIAAFFIFLKNTWKSDRIII